MYLVNFYALGIFHHFYLIPNIPCDPKWIFTIWATCRKKIFLKIGLRRYTMSFKLSGNITHVQFHLWSLFEMGRNFNFLVYYEEFLDVSTI